MQPFRYSISENTAAVKWSRKELVGRLIWSIVHPCFRFSPKLLWGWRSFLLRIFGAKIGHGVRIHPSVRVTIPWNLSIGDEVIIGFDVLLYNLGPMVIKDRCTISQRSHLCGGTHDYSLPEMPLVKATIQIASDSWICADAFIGPGVRIGQSVVVAARSVVIKDVPSNAIVAGNPARILKFREPNV